MCLIPASENHEHKLYIFFPYPDMLAGKLSQKIRVSPKKLSKGFKSRSFTSWFFRHYYFKNYPNVLSLKARVLKIDRWRPLLQCKKVSNGFKSRPFTSWFFRQSYFLFCLWRQACLKLKGEDHYFNFAFFNEVDVFNARRKQKRWVGGLFEWNIRQI